jgi:SIR2-like domain
MTQTFGLSYAHTITSKMSLITISNFQHGWNRYLALFTATSPHPEVLKALRGLHRRGARLMTTNYDELLKHYCDLQRVRRSIPEDVRKYEQDTPNGVFHIHVSFQDPMEVVLDPIGYYQVKTSDDVQNLLNTYLGHSTILFVGCGSGSRILTSMPC